MPGAAPSSEEPRAWEYLLAHHLPDRYERTLRIRLGARQVRVCTRCSAQVLGVVAFVVGALLAIPAGVAWFAPSAQLVVVLAPLPAAVDWTTQAIGRRESTSPLRLLTGALLGFAFADLLSLLVLRPWWWFAIGVGFAVAYLAAIAAVLAATGTWRSILAERFPGLVPTSPARPPPPPPPANGSSAP